MAEYLRPVALPVSSGYGPRGGRMHYGIDFSDGVTGHPIHATADGLVTYQAFEAGGLGNTVTITHVGNMKSGYGHMRDPAVVRVGMYVTQGQIIGYVGNTGSSTGPHLHYWMGTRPTPPGVVDPSPYVLHSPAPDRPGEELTLTPEEEQKLAQWEKDTRKIILDVLVGSHDQAKDKGLLGQWENDTRAYVDRAIKASEARIIAAINAK